MKYRYPRRVRHGYPGTGYRVPYGSTILYRYPGKSENSSRFPIPDQKMIEIKTCTHSIHSLHECADRGSLSYIFIYLLFNIYLFIIIRLETVAISLMDRGPVPD
jgi:hypothetical protein